MAVLKSKSGSSFNTQTGVKTSASGATTQVRSAKPVQKAGESRSDFLKSLNRKGSSNYQATPDDAGMENMDAVSNAKATGIDPTMTAPNQAQVNAPNAPTATPGNIQLNPQQQAVYDASIAKPAQAGQQYKQALAQTTASGVPTPPTIGQAGTTMNTAIQAPQTAPSPLTPIVEADSTFDSIFTNLDQYMEPLNQKKSLLQEYKGLSKALGIDEINEELINAKRIIEGTEDDIRSEVQAVSGFATDSQVLALSNARNKSLVKNYNVLLESRDNAMQQLNTMMDLSIEDRKMAEAEFDRKMNFAFKIAEFKEKAVSNAREGYANTIKLMGADGMYNALLATGDPSAMALAERTLGIPSGGLAIAAQQAIKARANEEAMTALDIEAKKSSIATDKAQRANIYSQINERKTQASEMGTLNGKPQNATQSAANSYANRMAEANLSINTLGSKFTGKTSQLPMFNFMKSSDRQVYEQAQKNFITAVLRRESGASIADSEFDTARDVYFPKPGDTPEVVKQKASTRNLVINNFYREANVPRPVTAGDIVEADGKQFKVEADGETLTEI